MKKQKTEETMALVREDTGEVIKGGIKKRKFRVQFDIEYVGVWHQNDAGEKIVHPDMGITVRQLIENHTRGINNEDLVRTPLFFETEIPTLDDVVDVQLFKESLERRLQDVNDFLADQNNYQTSEADSPTPQTPPKGEQGAGSPEAASEA